MDVEPSSAQSANNSVYAIAMGDRERTRAFQGIKIAHGFSERESQPKLIERLREKGSQKKKQMDPKKSTKMNRTKLHFQIPHKNHSNSKKCNYLTEIKNKKNTISNSPSECRPKLGVEIEMFHMMGNQSRNTAISMDLQRYRP